jgi:hypothetical protein
MSYRLIAAWIISTAQHANPKVKGQRDPARAQEIIDISFDEIHSSFKVDYFRRSERFINFVNPSGLEVP